MNYDGMICPDVIFVQSKNLPLICDCNVNLNIMQTKKFLRLIWVLLLSLMVLPEIKADNEVDFDGEWSEGKRTIMPEIPITAIENDVDLMIETTSTLSDITIRIVKDGNILYEETLYQPQTTTTIALDFLDPGTYRLELTNQWGDYLFGTFEK